MSPPPLTPLIDLLIEIETDAIETFTELRRRLRALPPGGGIGGDAAAVLRDIVTASRETTTAILTVAARCQSRAMDGDRAGR